MGPMDLSRYVFRHYAWSALIPLLTLELLLLGAYFGVNATTNAQTERTLREEMAQVMPVLVRQQADRMDADFRTIARQTRFFAAAHRDLFDHPEAFRVLGDPPRFALAPGGSLYQTNRREWSSLFYSRGRTLTPAQREKARITAALDPLYRQMVTGTPHVVAAYLNTPDDMNRLYPFIPKVYEQYPPDLNMEDYNFFYLADEQHNPKGEEVWTGVYLDPAGHGWMLSCVAPVYHRGTLAGVVGLDVTVADLVEGVLKMDLPWGASAFLAAPSGMILAMDPRAERLLGLQELKRHVYRTTISTEQRKPEEFNLFRNRDRAIAEAFRRIYDSPKPLHRLGSAFVVQDRIASTGWHLFVLVEEGELMRSVAANAALARRIGLGMVALMVGFYVFFFLFLRRRALVLAQEIAAPVEALSEAAAELGNGTRREPIPLSGVREIDELTASFHLLARQLDERSQALVASEVRARMQEKETELAFARGMYESASGYLHNVGNSVTRLESSLLDLEEVARSADQYPGVFRRLRDGPDPDLLERFRTVLLDRSVPRLREGVAEIRRIKDHILQTIRHQQREFRDARTSPVPVRFDLAELVRDLAARHIPRDRGFEAVLRIPPTLEIRQHRDLVHGGLVNVLKNAVEACERSEEKRILLTLERTDTGARLVVTDRGSGVAPEDRPRLLSAGFTTKEEGNGLGLHSFAVFLSAQGGRITLESDGPDLGTTVTVEVPSIHDIPE